MKYLINVSSEEHPAHRPRYCWRTGFQQRDSDRDCLRFCFICVDWSAPAVSPRHKRERTFSLENVVVCEQIASREGRFSFLVVFPFVSIARDNGASASSVELA